MEVSNIMAKKVCEFLFAQLLEVANITRDIPKEIAYIEDELENIQAFLNDMDRMLEAEEGNILEEIKRKVQLLREAAFRMEDIINEYVIFEEQHARDTGCAPLPCEPLHFINTMVRRRQLAYKIKIVKSEVLEIKKTSERDGFRIHSSLEQGPSSSTGNQDATLRRLQQAPFDDEEDESVGFEGPKKDLIGLLKSGPAELTVNPVVGMGGRGKTTSSSPRRDPFYDEEDEFVGFEDPKKELIGLLKSGRAERTVISLVGMGGLGKTTLAKLVFGDKEVIGHFNCHAWITVSHSYTINKLLRDMLQQLCRENKEDPPQDIDTMDEDSLIMEVRNYLRQKRYVVLFDDVWNEHFWDQIEFALPKNKNGSRIIITTRNMNVAYCCKKTSFVQVHELKPLSREKSLKLFYKKVFRHDYDGYYPKDLMDISSAIVEECNGLPLAIATIGGLLSSRGGDAFQWQLFSQNLSAQLQKDSHLSSLIDILGISYHDLPYHLKQCFLYFGIYPNDYEVESERLIRQWIAEGFVKSKMEENLEGVAEQYLAELIDRSLVQVSSFTSDGKSRCCRVHDLLYDFILRKGADLSFCQFVSEDDDQSIFSGKISHLTIATSSNNLMGSGESTNIRSLHIFRDEELPESFVRSIPKVYKLLRVLDFQDVPLYNAPENLGYLFHLRFLSFRNTKLRNLPRSIGTLHSLETLDLRQTMVREVPREINNLEKLRHLLAYDVSKGVGHGIQMNDGTGDLASLQTLREVETDHGGVKLIKELERLTQLRELGLTNVSREFTSALCSSINKMPHLEKLHIAAKDEDEVIDLQFHESPSELQKLRLIGKLNMFPNWVPELRNLVKLSLSYSKLTHDPLASLKDMPNLLNLSILYGAFEDKKLHFPDGGFQKLQKLILKCLDKLNSIVIDTGALPSLEKFTLVYIPQLKEVPLGIYNLPKLQVVHIMNMPDEFDESIDRDRGQHQWIIEKVPVESIVHRFWA